MTERTAAANSDTGIRTRLTAGYRPERGIFDELRDAAGEIRPHYRKFVEGLDGLGAAEIRRRWDTARRYVHEQGITYNVYGDPRGMERPWELDPIPFLIAPEEWRTLSEALIQRAVLINRILVDCHGPQRLIRSGGLPPALVFAQPDFLRACHGIVPAGETFLNLYAVDLARSPDGRWWVISDRTQIPTGAGYALANRLVVGRVLPEAFRDCAVDRLAGFFRSMQTSLARLASRHTDNPRVVVLTPGPYNETYFEQTYLARYLGYTLVEGQDLAVRDRRVYLKTLSGLEPVDVIVRRVDDEFCDPLELRNDSMLGVPGLVEAVREGNVAVANSVGSSLVQAPAFMAFLPGLCRHLLGEELKLPSVATWWCGQKNAERHVLEHLDELFIKGAFRVPVPGSRPGTGLTAAERETLRRRIRFQPQLFVGQEQVELSAAPAWSGDGLSARPIALRLYLVATPDGYKVMPGGLARVAGANRGWHISMQHGGAAKDVWVLSDGPVEQATLLHTATQLVELRRVGNNLSSRMADNFFWLGRYAERADFTARLLRAALLRFNPESTGGDLSLLVPLLKTLEATGQFESLTRHPELTRDADALEATLLALIFDPDRAGSLRHTAENLQRLATIVRDRTSNDFWRVLSELDDRLTHPASSLVLLAGDAIGVLNQTLLGLAAIHGLAMENMTRAQGWRFLDMGHRLERAIYTCAFLDASLSNPNAADISLLETVLAVADSTITYRSRYNLLPNLAAVYDLVLLDDTNPRSLLFQLQQLSGHFEELPREKTSALPSPGQRVLLDCLTRVRLADPTELARCGDRWHASGVAAVIRHVKASLPDLSNAIAASYFAHSEISRAGSRSGSLPGPALS